uniref:Si:dkeyp-118b1.2 n=1 Tax=Pundamilia nyererei TaxID=303518 RepID=A0A3B4FXN0_9CICH
MEEVSVSSLDNSKLEALAQDILSDLVEDACLGLCFEVHRAVKQGYFFLDDTDQESMRDFGEHRLFSFFFLFFFSQPEYCCLTLCSTPGEIQPQVWALKKQPTQLI